MSDTEKVDWKGHGVKVIPRDSLDTNTPQTPGMTRAAAIDFARAGSQKIWAGTVSIRANAKTLSLIHICQRNCPGGGSLSGKHLRFS